MASPGAYYVPPPRQRSIVGPLILIVIGTLFLLRNFGYTIPLMHNFVRFWPVLLVVIGLVRLAEYFAARSAGRPVPGMGGGTVFLLLIVIFVGLGLSAAFHGRNNINWGSLRDTVDVDDDLMNLFGSKYTFDGELAQQIPAGGTVRVNCERGNITVNNWDQAQVKVLYHKRVFAGSQSEADKLNATTQPKVELHGNAVDVQVNTEGSGPKGVATDVEIFLPGKTELELTARRGDVTLDRVTGNVNATLRHGSLHASNVTGNVTADARLDDLMEMGSQHEDVTLDQVTGNATVNAKHVALHVSNVTGNVAVDGSLTGLVLDTVSGTALVTADIYGDTRLAKLEKGVTIRTSRTELQFAKLDGDLTMDSDDLQGEGIHGPVALTTKTKNVNLRNMQGDIHISDDRGDIDVESNSVEALGNLDLTTHHGDVRLRLPAKANFQYQVRTRHGNISSDFEKIGRAHV